MTTISLTTISDANLRQHAIFFHQINRLRLPGTKEPTGKTIIVPTIHNFHWHYNLMILKRFW
ncbi:hypothetical protein MO867_21720 [Microbulbifer sp. OS29]|uniref:Uncharacterized protein n=1 Tax=Microbulbifer okhotskensis TaxID=2926617 RepID=A0A9X2ET11_9GAMM|nr:hypothetical protein [Microbulbifer okhotskensis]MCO1336950.1 hypothetical protein [Microbulbifer okhotskensis]